MLWAQITLVALFFISLLVDANRHGKQSKPKTYSFPYEFFILITGQVIFYFAGAYSHIVPSIWK